MNSHWSLGAPLIIYLAVYTVGFLTSTPKLKSAHQIGPIQDIDMEDINALSLRIIKVESVTTDMGSFEDKLQLCDFMTFTESTEEQTLHYDPGQVPRDLEEIDLKNFFKLSVCMRKLQIIVQELLDFYPAYRLGEKESKLLGIPSQGQGNDPDSNHLIRLALNAKRFGPDQMNFGVTNIEQLLKSITAPWSVREKLTILAYMVQFFCKQMTDNMANLRGKRQMLNDQMGEPLSEPSVVTTNLRQHQGQMGINVNDFYSVQHESTSKWTKMKDLHYSYVKLETLQPRSLHNGIPNMNEHNNLGDNFHNNPALPTVRHPCINNKNGCPIKTFSNLLFEHKNNCVYPTIDAGAVTSKIILHGPRRRFTAMCRSYEKLLGIVFSYRLTTGQLQMKAQSFRKSQREYVMVIYDENGRLKHRVQSITSRQTHLLPMTDLIHKHNIIYRILVPK